MKYKSIEIFGDSVLRGVTYDEVGDRYKLRDGSGFDTIGNTGIAVKNNSRMGATVDRGLDFTQKKLGECDRSHLVIFEYGGNDCDYEWKNISDSPLGNHSPHIEPKRYVETYCEMIGTALKKGASVAVTSLVPIDCGKYMRWISRGLSYDNILAWLGDESMLSRWQEYYSHLAEDIARRMGCLFIDLRREFLLSHDYGSLLCVDGIHPTQTGHELIENTLASYVLS